MDDLTPPHWGTEEMPHQMTDEYISAMTERLETYEDVPVSEIADAITALRAKLADAWAERAFTVSDGQRLLRKQDIITVCDTPDLCFESDDGVARCGPCAKKLAERDGITLNQYTVSNPAAMRLRRERDAANARADRAEAALAAQIEADAWQPIDTAPTDYTHIIGIDAKGCVARTWFFAPSSLTRAWLRVGLPGKAVWHPTHWKPLRETTAQPHDRTALDRMLRAEREKALQEAGAAV